ncbi:MAG: membrane dipeptidase, partial [Phycisphaeraceae bacterium]
MHRLIDGHLDLAYNALGYDRDQTCALETIRRREAKLTAPTVQETRGHGDSSEEHWGTATVTLPEMRRAGIAICLATVLQRVKRDYVRMRPPPLYELDHASQQIAHAAAQGQLAYYRVLEQAGELEMIRDARTLQTVWDKHREGAQGDPLPAIGYILSIEGCDPIVSPAQAQWWWQQGLRTACLAHYGQGVYGFGTGGDGPLTADGLELLRVFEQLGVILDLAHTAETGFYQALDQFHGPVFVSHGNCQALTPGDRQLSDEQLRLVI